MYKVIRKFSIGRLNGTWPGRWVMARDHLERLGLCAVEEIKGERWMAGDDGTMFSQPWGALLGELSLLLSWHLRARLAHSLLSESTYHQKGTADFMLQVYREIAWIELSSWGGCSVTRRLNLGSTSLSVTGRQKCKEGFWGVWEVNLIEFSRPNIAKRGVCGRVRYTISCTVLDREHTVCVTNIAFSMLHCRQHC